MVNITRLEPINAIQIQKKKRDNIITSKIIKQGVNSKLYTNIIKEQDSNYC